MKRKLLISLFSLTVAVFCFGQSDTILLNKKGKPILPQKGDFAVGISANPIFDYLGNMLSSSGNNNLSTGLLDNNIVFGKYYISAESAIRLKFSINKNSNTISNQVVDDNNSLAKVYDRKTIQSTYFQFMPGFEKHRGTGRLQITYGGELLFGYSDYSNSYTYGNSFSSSNATPTTTTSFESKNSSKQSIRFSKLKESSSLLYGIRGFVGVEYYILPKFAIGTEIGLSYTHNNIDDNVAKNEYWDFTSGKVATLTNKSGSKTSNSVKTDFLNGQFYLLYCF